MSNEQEWSAKKAAWKAEAEENLKSPMKVLRLEVGQSCATKGSWTLYNEQPGYRSYIDNDNDKLFVGLIPLDIKDIWALPNGSHLFSRLVNHETSGVRFVINRNKKGRG